jgi:hypothetical protein
LLKNVAVSLVGCTTQEWLENATSSDVFTGGFMGRCIVVPRGYTDKCYPTADYLDPIAKDEIAEALVPLATSRSFQLIIKDQAWYDEWYRENKRVMKNQTDKRLDGYFSRRPTHLVRLASVLSLSKRNRYITKEAMILADKILVHEEKYLVETVGGMGKHQRAKEADLIFAIIKQHGTPISRSKLSNKSFGITGGKRGLDRILESLLDRKVIDLAREGRSLVYFVIGES